MSRSPLKSALYVTAGAVLISFSAVFVRLADVAPTTSGFYRMFFGAVALALLLALRPNMRRGLGENWTGSLLIAVFFAFDIWFWHQSIAYIGPGLATLLANFQVFMLTAIGVVWLRERLGWRFASGLGLAMLGLWLLFGRDWGQLSGDYRLGVIFGLLTALAYGLYLLSLRGFQIRHPGVRAEARLTQVTVCCGIILAAVNIGEGHGFAIPDTGSLLSLIGLGVFCQVIGWLLITRGMPLLPAGIVGLLLLIQPSASVVWDLLWFGLQLDALDLAGIILALVGIYLGFRSASRRRLG
ncbi:MAG: DMT family transporter [Pseudomonadota bacterium]|nr:MAG: DMT family transporter [Pseudomonadota bacterium]